MRTALRWTLLISLLVHILTLPFAMPGDSTKMRSSMEKSKNTYLAKVLQKERGKIRGSEIRALVKPNPVPPDPQQYAQKAISDMATRGVVQVTSKLLSVDIRDSMVKHIQTTLADEIREMAEKLKNHQFSPEEYKKRQNELQDKVFVVAQQFGEKIREAGQIDIAAESVTDWYEKRVASQFKTMIRQGLFVDGNGPWNQIFARENAGFLRSDPRYALPYEEILDLLDCVANNRFRGGIKDLPEEARGKMKKVENDWTFASPDAPGLAHASAIAFLLNEQFKQWDGACADYFRRMHPHRAEETSREKQVMDGLWKELLSAAESYRKQAMAGAGTDSLAKASQAVVGLVKSLKERGEKLAVRNNPGAKDFPAANQALRARLVRGPFLDELHTYLVNRIVERIKPAVSNLARNQFREGMVYSKDGVEKAIRDFGVSSVSLLRRDIAEALTKPLLQRGLFMVTANPYRSKLSEKNALPTDEDIARDEQALAQTVAKWPAADKAYVEKRTEAIKAEIKESVDRTIEALLKRMVDKDGVLERDFYAKAETVDYTDPLQVRLELRNRALKGRGQDMADITEEGVPDTANPRVALVTAAESGQLAITPVLTTLHPNFFASAGRSAQALRASPPVFSTAPPADWGFVEQITVQPAFQSPAFEAIPFLPTPPPLDGDLRHWGRVRPLQLSPPKWEIPYLGKESIFLYAGWNYQGFFFGYHVPQPKKYFYRSSEYIRGADGVSLVKRGDGDFGWVIGGDCLMLCFDTLDARSPIRGDSNTQEFFILPAGTESDATTPGAERFVASRRDAQIKTDWGNFPYCRCSLKVFPPQPEEGPDGRGPYRVTKFTDEGYTVEVFIPRSLLKAAVMAPGWYMGFDCTVLVGKLPVGEGIPGQANHALWRRGGGNHINVQSPASWGDLLLLGTDAEVRIQDAQPGWPATTAIMPGHSCLVTIIDPDHNVNPAAVDSLLVSAEVMSDGGAAAKPPADDDEETPAAPPAAGKVDDVEVFILKETGNNTGVFRGIINTQPGSGGRAHGIVEVLPGRSVRLAYEDFADSKGQRNVVHEIKLPVVSAVLNMNGQ